MRISDLISDVCSSDLVALELLGPLGCGFQTGAGGVMNSLACPAGSSIAIFGGGPVGLAAVMGAVIQGCATIILVEPIAARRDIGHELGATHVIDPAEAGELAAALRAIGPAGPAFPFDTNRVRAEERREGKEVVRKCKSR